MLDKIIIENIKEINAVLEETCSHGQQEILMNIFMAQ